LTMGRADVWIEIRGARGEFQINRLQPGEFTFRSALQEGRPLADAAERAMELDGAFEPGRALAGLVADGAVTAITFESQGDDR
jgi:hypothetical protein